MAKIVLDTVTGGYDLSIINNNFDKIETELQNKVLYRNNPVGESNTLETDVDTNGKRIYNLPEPLLDGEAARLQDIQNALAGGAANLITFTPYGHVVGSNVQAAVQELIEDTTNNGVALPTFLKDSNTLVVDNITALKAVDKTKFTKALVLGYYTKGDGASGTYWYDSTDVVSVDNGGTAIVANDGGRWKLVHNGSVTVRQFGAKGDGVTNDVVAIRAGTVAMSASAGKLVFPAGTYRVAAHVQLLTNTHWVGEDASIYLDPTFDFTGAGNYGGGPRAIWNTAPISDVTLSGLVFYSGGGAASYPSGAPTVALISVTGLTLRDCTFRDMGSAVSYAQGFIGFGCTIVSIENCVFSDCSGDGAAFAETGSNIRVTGCSFTGNDDWGLAFSNGVTDIVCADNFIGYNTSTGTGVDECTRVLFSNNVIVQCEHGVRVAKFVGAYVGENRDITIVGNTIVSCQFGISAEDCTGFVVSGNSVRLSTDKGIRLSNALDGSVSGNMVSTSTNEAIFMETSGGVSIAGNMISGATYGVRQISNNGGRTTVAGNTFRQCSTANVDGVLYSLNTFNQKNATAYISGPMEFDSGVISLTASAGGVVSPGNFWGYLPIQVGADIKKIPLFSA